MSPVTAGLLLTAIPVLGAWAWYELLAWYNSLRLTPSSKPSTVPLSTRLLPYHRPVQEAIALARSGKWNTHEGTAYWATYTQISDQTVDWVNMHKPTWATHVVFVKD